MAKVSEQSFSKWRSFLWPIHGFELKKIIPMLLMFFCVSFNYTILRDVKDTLVVTAPGSGAEIIPFLKVWCVIPMAIFFMLLYSKMSNIMSKKKLFYATIIPFLAFFTLFSTVIYPCREFLHPTVSADWLQSHLSSGFMGIIAIFRNWSYALFYVMAELWGSVALSLVLWGFANDITRVTEAKRFYPLLGIGANVALMVSGPLIMKFSKFTAGVDAFGTTLLFLTGAIVTLGVVLLATYSWMQRNVLTDPRFFDANEQKKKKKEKPSMSLVESFKFLAKSKYLGCLAFLVFAYGISINIVEVTWKGQLKLQYPDPQSYLNFMGLFSTITGGLTILMMLFVGSNLLRSKGWTFTALVTPVMLLLTGTLFFSFIIFRGPLTPLTAAFAVTPVMFAVIFGMVQNMLTKSSKYSLFDPTKEMAYIPLDQESKVKGKAAIDVVGARMGKSGGALLQQFLIIAFGSLAAITPFVAIILFAIVIGWIFSAKSLGKQFGDLTAEQEEKKAREELEAEKAKASDAGISAEKVTVTQS